MENIDIAATTELLLGIVILYFIAKSLIKSRSEKNVIGHIETPAPYKVETPAPVVEVDQAPVVEAPEATATPTPKTRARKDASAKKPAVKKAPAKKTAKKTASK